MVMHRSNSRVLFQRGNARTTKARADTIKQHTKAAMAFSSKWPRGTGLSGVGTVQTHNLTLLDRPVFEEDDSDEEIYDDSDEELYRKFDDEPPYQFIKERVSSLEERKRSGALTSQLSATKLHHPSPPSSDGAAAAGDPSASLLVDASQLFVPAGDKLVPVPKSEEVVESSPEAQLCDAPAPSLLQKVVALFAGWGKSLGKNAMHHRRHSSPDTKPAQSEHMIESAIQLPKAESTRAPSDTWQPRLTLPQVIPKIQIAGADDPSQRSGFLEIPPAMEHQYTGHSSVAEDTFNPAVVQRGFEVVERRRSLTPVSLLHRRTSSAASLLDRDGQTWANWHLRHPSPERMPFARVQSVNEELDQQATKTDLPKDEGSSSHCFLEHTGDNYPYRQGLCW